MEDYSSNEKVKPQKQIRNIMYMLFGQYVSESTESTVVSESTESTVVSESTESTVVLSM